MRDCFNLDKCVLFFANITFISHIYNLHILL